MRRLLQIELYKLFRSSRTYLTFGIAIIIMLIINLGLFTDGKELFAFLLQSISEYFYLEGNVINGYLIAYLALNTLWVHIPILIIIVTAHIVSSEFEYGTIRMLLTQPVSRIQVLMAKVIATMLFVICFMVVIALFALIPSVLIFDSGDVVVFIDGIQFLEGSSFLWRFFMSIGFAVIAMFAFACMTMYFAIIFKNTLTSILLAFGILILFTLLQTFVFGIFSSWQPFLFTYHFAKWQLFFMNDIPYDSILNSIYFLLGMSALFLGFSFVKFNKMTISQ